MEAADLRRIFAANLRQLASRRRLSLNHLADRAGMNRASLYRLLGCEVSATLATVAKLADVLEVPPRVLIDERTVPTPPV